MIPLLNRGIELEEEIHVSIDPPSLKAIMKI
jgi:hypothetical protein